MKIEKIKFNDFWLPLALEVVSFAKKKKSRNDYEAFCKKQTRSRRGSLLDRLEICESLIEVKQIIIIEDKMNLNLNPNFQWLETELMNGNTSAWEFVNQLGFKNKIIKKFNDENKKETGLKGEKYIIQMLKKIFPTDKHNQIKHISLEDDTAGYDIECPDINMVKGKSYLEVKTTSIPGQEFIFYISRNEFEVSLERKNNWFIVLVKIVDGQTHFFGKLDYNFIKSYRPQEHPSSLVKWESLKVTITEKIVDKNFIDIICV